MKESESTDQFAEALQGVYLEAADKLREDIRKDLEGFERRFTKNMHDMENSLTKKIKDRTFHMD